LRNGWNVHSYSSGYSAPGGQYKSYEYVLLGRSRAVVVQCALPEILEASEVERVLVKTLDSLVDRTCQANNGDLVVSTERDALDAERLRRWIVESSFLQSIAAGAMQSGGAT
jgi:hypothetical protein